ncbi:diguanylate cyclase [Dactylosporangium sp. CA-092794]|uniref:diguanylate cyclase n=1 Tax=Dactylosporangium sp. CA-092794 TaxID=3239929 RepID=UPI003D944141
MVGGSARASAVARGAVHVAGLEVLGEIGRGAHAVVYRARRDGADYALKVLRGDVGEHEEVSRAIRREAGLLACVSHPCVGRVYEVGTAGGRPYLVLELLHGRPLADVLDAGPLPVPHAIRLAADLAGALAAAHRVGVVHRDVTPQNVMVDSGGRPMLVDFGLAVHTYRAAGDETAGTFAYAAPEQTAMLARTVDGRADLYALGVVLFECLTGRRPFEAPDVGELIRLHAVAPPPDVPALRPEVPPELAAIVGRLLAKDPDDRYQDGEALAKDLRALLGARYALSAGSAVTAGPARRPLVGRQAELARLEALWHQARLGSGTAVRLVGPSGIGKTRLADELADRVRGGGRTVLELPCTPGAPPLAPIRTALERHVRGLDRLPAAERDDAIRRLRTAAGTSAAVLQLLSPALADVLHAPRLTDEDRQEQLGTAVTAFLGDLARAEGGLLLYVDDAQWLDGGSARVLRELASAPRGAPLLLLTTEPDDPAASAHDTRIRLRPLAESQVVELASTQLGGTPVAARLGTQLTNRSEGNPFAVLEYLRAMLDACVIRPAWGSWLLDERALDRLALPADVLDLIVGRVGALPAASRRLLVAAAVIGAPFRPGLLAEAGGVGPAEAVSAVEDAVSRGILERDGGTYAFLHVRVSDAILADRDAAEIRALHQRVATALDGAGPVEPDQWYVIAAHYARGDRDERPDRMYRACLAAARTAMAEQAPARALEYLDLAADAAQRGDVMLDSAYHRAVGLARLRTGGLAAARESLATAASIEPDPFRRAEILGLVAEAQQHDFAANDSVETVRQALAEAGHRLPANRLLLLGSTLWFVLLGIVGRRRGIASGPDLDRFRTQAALFDIGSLGAGVAMRPLLSLCLLLRSGYVVNRVGPGPQYVRLQTGYGMVAGYGGARRRARRCFARAAASAELTGDPGLRAYVAWAEAMATDGIRRIGPSSGAALRSVLQEHGRWLELGHYQFAVSALGAILMFRGYAHEASHWYERARARMDAAVATPRNPVATLGVLVAACAGNRALLERRLAEMRDTVEQERDDPSQRLNLVVAAAHTAAHYGDEGHDIRSVVAQVRRLRLTPRKVWVIQRQLWLELARGLLASLRSAEPGDRPALARSARWALRTLRRARGGPALRAYHHVVCAEYLRLTGAPRRALRRLARAELLGQTLDLPLLSCEAATIRARVLNGLGHRAEADRQAGQALRLATQLGLEHRARALRAEFRIAETGSPAHAARTAGAGRTSSPVAGPAARRLAAVQQISVAAATVLDVDQLARVALDETIGIFAAERAILFVPDPATGRLVPHLGRGPRRTDLDELTSYGSTFVEQVRQSGEAVVVTSGEHGVALGSHSVVTHGLRSVMVAPLQLQGELLGAVYLDSRVAKGVFTADDVDILTTITNQIAASMVTAQAAQLELTVRTAERRSELADIMRTSMAEVSETLDPQAVTARLLATLVRTIGADLGVVLHDDGTCTSTATPGARPVADPAALDLLDLFDSPGHGAVETPDAPVVALLPAARAWLAIPLAGRQHRVGLLLLLSAGEPYDDGRLRVAVALAEQGMVAHDNALLYRQVRRLASTDPLTGLYNRRTFFELSDELFAAAGDDEPSAAVMLDIDHFKRVNDTHGHAAGDDVIREVAARLRRALRHGDVLGRHGGEEFALWLPRTTAAETAEVAERLRHLVTATPVATRAGPLRVTMSAGCTQRHAADRNVEDTLARADKALYEAKQNGRDRVATR